MSPEFSQAVSCADLGESLRQLSDQTGKRHIEGRIQITGLWTRIVFEYFHGDSSIVGDNHTRLYHPQQPGDALGFAESAGRVDYGICIVAIRNRIDSGESQADFG